MKNKNNKKRTLNERVTELETDVKKIVLKDNIKNHIKQINDIKKLKRIAEQDKKLRTAAPIFIITGFIALLTSLFSVKIGNIILAKLCYGLACISFGALIGTIIIMISNASKK